MSNELFLAIERNDLGAVRSLVSNAVDVNFTDCMGDFPGYCPLTLAAEVGNVEIVRELLAAGAMNQSFIRDAIRHEHTAIVQEWLEHFDDVDIVDDSDGITPLIHAAIGKIEIVRLLVEAGANVNALSSEGETPLSRAVYAGKEDIVQYLLPISSERSRRIAGLS